MILGSKNLYSASKKNREMGVWIDKKKDEDFFNIAINEAEQIIEFSDKKHPESEERRWYFCNRCGEPMEKENGETQHKDYKNNPFWRRRGPKEEYREFGYCHLCRKRVWDIGKPIQKGTTIKTMCKSCWKKSMGYV
jgi:hypothetical protein